MKYFTVILFILIYLTMCNKTYEIPEHFKHVDQVIWVVNDLDNVIDKWEELGFQQIEILGNVTTTNKDNENFVVKMAVANLGGAHITWIEPVSENSVFSKFQTDYGEGAMSLVHKLSSNDALYDEVNRLSAMDVKVLDKLLFSTPRGKLNVTLMDTQVKGKYVLGYVTKESSDDLYADLTDENKHNMKLNQYAFAIIDAEEISKYWSKIGLPEFQINHPELGDTKYHGEFVDHSLIQGWQRHGDIVYEWCIPVKGPIVYTDHINKYGEGIHHLAYSVKNMDEILKDYVSLGYQNTMGGTWGESGNPGSGRYEYVGLESAGGMTIELLWNYQEN